ncbi:class I SAM-dependent methyltransferase [Kibdelosporangium philippinense]|uniref:Class I SAM-dependent methyltransferase n=1 Tax=Kibdelosporangium philippinense TaxID=211113 RepID=A0ABS8ZKH2_9PSEU|nr:class I SAM-dependent methyltransferase [Kibdelosporangium philippinense]MCE7007944.1 class I SAM-dependent methyltransferase [Kibdelosporangium philippinense]
MGYRFTLEDVAFLGSPAGEAALAEIDKLPLTSATHLADVGSARRSFGDRAPMLLETVLLRRKAVSKLDVTGWLFTDDALQQATPWQVAAHRAQRFSGRVVHDVTCSIGTELVHFPGFAVGSDLDPVRVAMARHNTGRPIVQADAVHPVTRDAAILADPARRDSSGRRRWRPADFTPPLDALASVYRDRDMAVKCAPGIDPADVPWASEIELVSLDGSVRESCLWTGSLATPGVQRRATVLRSAMDPWTITDASPDSCPVTAPAEWIIDPDGAVVRAGLVRHYAAAHGLAQLDPRIAYLTGDRPPPGIRAFRMIEYGRYSEKSLRQVLGKHGVGRLEILVRGLDVDPNAVRPRLKLRGEAEATVVLTRIGQTPTALLCKAERIPAEA